jgi:hypothetical protein
VLLQDSQNQNFFRTTGAFFKLKTPAYTGTPIPAAQKPFLDFSYFKWNYLICFLSKIWNLRNSQLGKIETFAKFEIW